MAGYPTPNLGTPPMSAGVPQWFSKAGDPHSWYPGVTQFNLGLSKMMQQFGSLDPDMQNFLQTLIPEYGAQEQKQIGMEGQVQSNQAAAKAAAGYDPNSGMAIEAEKGLRGGSGAEAMANYAAQLLPGYVTPQAGAISAEGQVPGQMELMKQAATNQYKVNQLKQLSQMMDLISSAAGGQFGYESAQLGADRGQIALDNAQSSEGIGNLSSLMTLIFGNQTPSLFGGGQNALFSGGQLGPTASMIGSFIP